MPDFCDACERKGFHANHSYSQLQPAARGDAGKDLHDSCTFTDKTFQNQYWYECADCFPADKVKEGVCTFCARTCRTKNHTLTLRYGGFFCDKGAMKAQRERMVLETTRSRTLMDSLARLSFKRD
jgi:hypothetical protein